MAEQPGSALNPVPFPDLFRLDGRVALVTGGAGLLGRRYCEALLQAGARVVIGDVDGAGAEALAAELDTERALGLKLDVTNEASVNGATQRAVQRFKRLDILVNNAALTVRGGSERLSPADYFAPFESYKRDVWQRAVDVNLTGMLLCAQAAGRQMLLQDPPGGVMVNISSTYGVVAPDQRVYDGVRSPYADATFNTPVSYAVTKTAVLGLTRYLATYWGKNNIRVNALTPHGVYDNHDDAFVRNFVYRSPLGRMARNDEYRGALLFLVSDASSYMTGANLIVDGGWTAW
ncbi:MAG: SDR family oxidoreductase [Chloroflexi bacterium]|nr:MAG: SDR family oxidoreductase [Chloroflexota bacterium]